MVSKNFHISPHTNSVAKFLEKTLWLLVIGYVWGSSFHDLSAIVMHKLYKTAHCPVIFYFLVKSLEFLHLPEVLV